MSHLKSALIQIEAKSKTDFQSLYDSIVELYLDEDLDLTDYDIDQLVTELKDVDIEVKQINGLLINTSGNDKKIFAHATYGWDGGSAIDTEEFNLKSLETTDFGGGPTAAIVELNDNSFPGIALHYSSNDEFGEIHIFA